MFNIDKTKFRSNGLKVPLKNFLDKRLYATIDPLCRAVNTYSDHDMIPNVFTTISLGIRLYGLYALYRDNKITASICFFAGYYFDCADGYYARKYNKCTPFGCVYDHLNDITTCLLYGIVAWRKKMYITVIMLILLTLFTVNQIMCDEAMFSNKTPFFELICTVFEKLKFFNSDEEFVKYFGTTTWIVMVSMAILIE